MNIENLDSSILSEFKLFSTGGCYEFKEAKSDKCKVVKIHTSSKSLALILDKENKKLFNFFDNSNKTLTSINDGVILINKKDKLIALLLELKSDNSSGYLRQLKSGKNFIEYFINQVKLATKASDKKVEYRGILFKTGRVNASKNTTKRTPIKYEDRNGLLCVELFCNNEYRLQQFIENI